MQIREATEQDIPQIIEVLKASLGETSSKKSEEVWRYKHLDNPFGKSLVLVAMEDEKVIGVRAFMRWQWQIREQVYSAFRAVDTATHPDHQGKGIFKKLTLKALEIGKERGDHFVFNTPNEQSKPGYLKMGWEEVAKINVGIRPVNPIYWKKSIESPGLSVNIQCSAEEIENLVKEINLQRTNSGKIFTPKTLEYLRWRYENNPLQDYQVTSTANFYIAGYIKTHSKFRELRISEILVKSGVAGKTIKNSIKTLSKDFGVQIISFAPKDRFSFRTGIYGKFGPVLTIRNMNMPEQFEQDILILNNWSYALGDLELF